MDQLRLRDRLKRVMPRVVVLSAQEVHLVRLAVRASHETCRTYPGGPSPRSRTEQFDALAQRFERMDAKDDFE